MSERKDIRRGDAHLRKLLLTYLRHGELNDEEAADLAGIPKVDANGVTVCYWARSRDLRRWGLLEPVMVSGSGNTVWATRGVSEKLRALNRLSRAGRVQAVALQVNRNAPWPERPKHSPCPSLHRLRKKEKQ